MIFTVVTDEMSASDIFAILVVLLFSIPVFIKLRKYKKERKNKTSKAKKEQV